MQSPVIDFPPKHHPIHDYYGVNQFVLFSPNVPNEKEDIDNETRAKIALSTVTVAIHNTNCQVPFFVQVSCYFSCKSGDGQFTGDNPPQFYL